MTQLTAAQNTRHCQYNHVLYSVYFVRYLRAALSLSLSLSCVHTLLLFTTVSSVYPRKIAKIDDDGKIGTKVTHSQKVGSNFCVRVLMKNVRDRLFQSECKIPNLYQDMGVVHKIMCFCSDAASSDLCEHCCGSFDGVFC